MINFTDKHFFGPKGEVHLIHDKMDLHTDYVFQNPKLFGFKSIEHADSLSNDQFWNKVMDNGFIRGEYFQTQGNARKPIHNHNLTYEASKGAIPSKFVKALETLHRHYSQKPNTEFKIGVFAGSNMKEDASLSNILSKITGGGYELSTLDHIKQMIDLGKGNKENQPVRPVKKISRREIEQNINTRLGKEIPMGRGDMTTAEWNFWRQKGLGDSYMHNNNLKLIKEHLYTKLYERFQDGGDEEGPFLEDEPLLNDQGLEQWPIHLAPHWEAKPEESDYPIWWPFKPGAPYPPFMNYPEGLNDPRLTFPGLNWLGIMEHLALQFFEQHGFWPPWWPYEDAGPWPSGWDPSHIPSVG